MENTYIFQSLSTVFGNGKMAKWQKKKKKLEVTEGELGVRHVLENLLGLLLLNIKIRFLMNARILTFEASGHVRYMQAKYQILLPVIVLLKCDVVQSTQ